MMKQQILITCFVFFSSLISVQLLGQEHQKEEEVFVPHHAIGLVISHAHVFSGLDADGHRKVLSLPSWGVDYTYHVSEKWALGLHTDIITETFEVEKNLAGGSSAEVLERSHPVAPAVMTIYKPNHHWNLLFGIGMEFAKEENLFLNRLGAEYSAEIRGDSRSLAAWDTTLNGMPMIPGCLVSESPNPLGTGLHIKLLIRYRLNNSLRLYFFYPNFVQ